MRFLRNLYAQVLVAIVAGALLGHFAPAAAVQLKPLGDAFVKLIKLVIAPLVVEQKTIALVEIFQRPGGGPMARRPGQPWTR